MSLFRVHGDIKANKFPSGDQAGWQAPPSISVIWVMLSSTKLYVQICMVPLRLETKANTSSFIGYIGGSDVAVGVVSVGGKIGGNVLVGEDVGVDDDDVSHGHKSSDAGQRFLPEAGL